MRKKRGQSVEIAAVESAIGYVFSRKDLLEQALTHRSFLNEHQSTGHNERLEFLGDAVLQLVATRELYDLYPDEDEGTLSLYRSRVVRTEFLADASERLGLRAHLRASAGQGQVISRGGARSLLANVAEAVIGAIYRDGGFNAAASFILSRVLVNIPNYLASTPALDPKTELQELVQRDRQVTPTYTPLKSFGPDNDKTFVVGVRIGNDVIAEGSGHSKQEAERQAAERALETYEAGGK